MNKKIIITIVSTVIAGLLIIGAFFASKNMQGEQSAKPLEKIIEAQTTGTLSASGLIARDKLTAPLEGKSEALLITDDFEIGYLNPPGERLMIFIFSETPEIAEQSAISWIKSRGFTEDDICNFPTIISGVGPNHLPSFCEGSIGVE